MTENLAVALLASRGASQPEPERWLAEQADALLAAEASRTALAPLTQTHPELSLLDAYRIQWAGALRRVERGARVVGHKVGLTSVAMQQQVGIDQPDSGVLLGGMVVADGGRLRLGELLSPRVEAEVAFVLGQDLTGADVDVGQARAAVEGVCLALEAIDTRYTCWHVTVEDSVADNAACARVVVGPVVKLAGLDLRDEQLRLVVDGVSVAAGPGRAVLGDPLNSLAWLARRLHGFGVGLRAGDLVLAGAVHASIPLTAGTQVAASAPRLPGVHAHVI